MANWTTIRNSHVNAATSAERARQVLALLCENLLTAGWSLIGQGGGTGSGVYQFNAAGGLSNLFSAFPAAPNVAAWIVMRNSDGLEICVSNETSNNYLSIVVSPADGFVAGSSDEDTKPDNPADAYDSGTGSYTDFGNSGYQFYAQFAYTDDSNSFIMWSRASGNNKDWLGAAVCKLENVDAADALPTYCPYWIMWSGSSGNDVWTSAVLGGSSIGAHQGYHPSGSWQTYTVGEVEFEEGEVFDNIGADPITGDQPRLTSLCGCGQPTYYHIRGTIPGIWRIPSALATGDHLDSDLFIVIGNYAVPWGSADPMNT